MKTTRKLFLNAALALSLATQSLQAISVPSVVSAIPVRKIVHGLVAAQGGLVAGLLGRMVVKNYTPGKKATNDSIVRIIFGCAAVAVGIDAIRLASRVEKLEKEKAQAALDSAAAISQAKLANPVVS